MTFPAILDFSLSIAISYIKGDFLYTRIGGVWAYDSRNCAIRSHSSGPFFFLKM